VSSSTRAFLAFTLQLVLIDGARGKRRRVGAAVEVLGDQIGTAVLGFAVGGGEQDEGVARMDFDGEFLDRKRRRPNEKIGEV
jgi:hypothetical protein